jgi:hypothetical protein
MAGFAQQARFEDEHADAPRGPSADEARESLTYWRARLVSLPVTRRAQRREAKAMIVRWEERLRTAERARWGDNVLGRVAGSVAVWRDERGVSLTRRAAAFVPRWVKLTVASVVVASVAVAGLAVVAVLDAIF